MVKALEQEEQAQGPAMVLALAQVLEVPELALVLEE